MKTKYLQKNTSPHLGKLLKDHIIKHSVYRSSLSRYMERQPSTIEYYLKQPTLQTALLWELSTALKHNFFKDLAAQLPADFTTKPAKILISVDFPAPFGPSSPKIEPRGMFRSTPFNASLAGLRPVAA